MKLLAIDTSSIACSVAVGTGDAVFERHEERAREHTRLLTPMIRDVLAESGCALAGLDAIVVGNGPGSFIGMRIAASVAQGLAHGAGLPIVPVSSLAAVAAQVFAETGADQVIVAQDAHMNEVYLGGYRRGEADLPEPIFDERLHGHLPVAELDRNGASERVAAGAGWQRYPELTSLNEHQFERFSDILQPRARYLLAMGAAELRAGHSVDPEDLVPAYLRHKVAEKPAPETP